MELQYNIRNMGMVILLLLTGPCGFILAQEAESRAVRFHLNTLKDMEAPAITFHSPVLDTDHHYVSETDQVEVIGEVIDDTNIRFVSVNNDIMVVDETGLFASTISLDLGENSIRVKSMDENGNMKEVVLVIEYVPAKVTLAERISRSSVYYGLIIGINEYQDPRIPDLGNPVQDARNVYRSLVENYTFMRENVVFLENPERGDIIRELDVLRGKINEEDNLLIFYAGHGFWDEEAGIGYWLPSDATRETTAQWFRNGALVDYLNAIRTKHTLLITDACFAGSIFKARSVKMDSEVVYDRIYEIPSRKAMTSGAMTKVPDRSAFVKYLVRRLEDNQAMYLSSEELFYSFKMAVISNSSTNVLPQYGEILNAGNEGGDFIFLKRE